MNDKIQYLISQVSKNLGKAGYKEAKQINPMPTDMNPDAWFRKGEAPLLFVEAHAVNAYRSKVFPALVGDFILRLRDAQLETDGLIAFILKRFSHRAVNDLNAYADAYHSKLNWLVMDEVGSGILRFDQRVEKFDVAGLVPKDSEPKNRKMGNRGLFSPNNQWLLKILLLAGLDRKYWAGPSEKPKSINQLAEISGVSQPSVSSFISTFEKSGYLQRNRRGFVIRQHRELMNDWFYASKFDGRDLVPVQPLFGGAFDEDEFLAGLHRYFLMRPNDGSTPNFAIGHHLGCHLLGIGRSNVRVGWLYAADSFQKSMVALDLVQADSDASNLYLVKSSSPKSLFPGCIDVDGVPVCDIIQCYLDVRSSQARGHEQAEFIYERILEPHFQEAD